MKKEETVKILRLVQATFPNYFKTDMMMLTAEMWHEAFVYAEIEYKFAHKALTQHISESTKPPTVADICRRAKEIEREEFFANGGRT